MRKGARSSPGRRNGYRASWEALVSIKDLEATRRVATICENAQLLLGRF